jgi:hypothetical protein
LSASGLLCDNTRALAAIMAWAMSGKGLGPTTFNCWRACMSAMRSVVKGWLRK